MGVTTLPIYRIIALENYLKEIEPDTTPSSDSPAPTLCSHKQALPIPPSPM